MIKIRLTFYVMKVAIKFRMVLNKVHEIIVSELAPIQGQF